MSWSSILLLVLQLAESLFSYVRNKQLIDAGEDRAVAEAAARILAKTEFAKQTREIVDGMSGDSLDDLLSRLAKDGG